jgi:DNA-binding response OmpR family regulator
LDEFGVLRQNGTIVFLSPREQALAELLIADFGAVVRDEVFEQHVFGESGSRRETLRTHTSRLRKRIAPLGLTISCIRNVGYMMHHDNADAFRE